jgi:hypothetical protein
MEMSQDYERITNLSENLTKERIWSDNGKWGLPKTTHA